MRKRSPKHQQGSAALLFLMIFPALFAVFVWGLEGARMLQTSARLKDATESAALAVSSLSNVDNTVCSQVTERFVGLYFPSAAVASPSSNEDSVLCVQQDNDSDFNITASVTEQSWFPNAQIPNYGAQFTATDSVRVRKQQVPVDVVLVASYAATMSGSKSQNMTTLMGYVADQLKAFNQSQSQDSTLAVVGYDRYTSELGTERYGFFSSRERTVRLFSHNLVCDASGSFGGAAQERAKLCFNWFGSFSASTILDANQIDADATVANIFNEDQASSGQSSSSQGSFLSNLFGALFDLLSFIFDALGTRNPFEFWQSGGTSYSLYETLPLTSDFDGIKSVIQNTSRFSVNAFGVEGSSYTGLIEAARVANEGQNQRRLIILLTDGKDASPSVAQSLVNAGLCQTIRSHFASQNPTVQVDLAIIGFDYDQSKGAAMQQCIGGNNVFAYSSYDDDANQNMIDGILKIDSKNNSRLIN